MRVAIPTKDGKIAPEYTRAREFTVYEVEIELVKKKEIIPLGKTTIADFLTEQEINVVICGSIHSSERPADEANRTDLRRSRRNGRCHDSLPERGAAGRH